MTQWYYADAANERQGPITADTLRALLGEQRLGAASLVWREGLAGWQPLSTFAGELALEPDLAISDAGEVTEAAADAAPPDVPEPGTGADSPYAAPRATVASVERIVLGGEVVYAGFWKRAAAQVIDLSLSWFLGSLVGGVATIVLMGVLNPDVRGGGLLFFQASSWLITLGVSAMYYGWFHCSGTQATLGKMAVGIKLVRGDGQRVGFWRAIGRYFGLLLSLALLGGGVIMAAFVPRKRALHDLLCDTQVVDRWAYTTHPQWQRRELGVAAWVLLALSGLALLLFVGLMAFISGLF